MAFSGVIVYGNKFLSTKAETLQNKKAEYKSIESKQLATTKLKKDIAKYSDLNDVMIAVVPQEKDQAKTVREILQISNLTGVPIGSFNFPSSNLGSPSTPRSLQAGNGTMSQTIKVPGVEGVEQMQITVVSASPVPYPKFISFLEKLEQNRRTSQVSSVTISPDKENRDLIRFSLIVNVYIRKAV